MNKRNATTQAYYGMTITYYTRNKVQHAEIVLHHDELPKPYVINGMFVDKCFVFGCGHLKHGFTLDVKYKTRMTPKELGNLRYTFFNTISIEKLYSLTLSCRECYRSTIDGKCYCNDCFGCQRFNSYHDYDNDNFRYAYIYDTKVTMCDYHMQKHTDKYGYCFDCMKCDEHCFGYHYEDYGYTD